MYVFKLHVLQANMTSTFWKPRNTQALTTAHVFLVTSRRGFQTFSPNKATIRSSSVSRESPVEECPTLSPPPRAADHDRPPPISAPLLVLALKCDVHDGAMALARGGVCRSQVCVSLSRANMSLAHGTRHGNELKREKQHVIYLLVETIVFLVIERL